MSTRDQTTHYHIITTHYHIITTHYHSLLLEKLKGMYEKLDVPPLGGREPPWPFAAPRR